MVDRGGLSTLWGRMGGERNRVKAVSYEIKASFYVVSRVVSMVVHGNLKDVSSVP